MATDFFKRHSEALRNAASAGDALLAKTRSMMQYVKDTTEKLRNGDGLKTDPKDLEAVAEFAEKIHDDTTNFNLKTSTNDVTEQKQGLEKEGDSVESPKP